MSGTSAVERDARTKGLRQTARKVIRVAASPLFWIVALFGGAGRLDWARGWISVALWVGGVSAIGLVVRRYNAPVMEAREKWRRKDTKPFDKVFLAALLPLVFLQPAVAGLDVVRLRWSSMPGALAYPGAVLLMLAMALIAWAMAVNRHAEATVRIQTDRAHTVVDSGPYRVVRHPMYVGAILMYVATPLVWGSVAALGITGVIIVLFILRTAMEDMTLRLELPGYKEYATRTPYRLLPRVW